MKLNRFAWFAWITLAFNLLVIVWGAFVRATGSGAGCGGHWPLCNGQIVPPAPQMATLIEFGHRMTSGLSLLLIGTMLIWALRAYPRRHVVRRGAILSLVFVLMEALIGAVIVELDLVAHNASITRAFSGSAHLVNTFLLVAVLTLTAWWASGGQPLQLQGQGSLIWMFGLGIVATLVLGAIGAITALGDTLFPAHSLAQGLQQDFSPTEHLFLRLRVYHPILAVVTGGYLIAIAFLASRWRPAQQIRRFAVALSVLFALQIGAGVLDVYLLAPIWMQLVHLLLADSIWITLVLTTAATFAAVPVYSEYSRSSLSQIRAT